MNPLLHCQTCAWTGYEDDLKPSWRVNSMTVDEPYSICPSCGGVDFEDVPEDEDGE